MEKENLARKHEKLETELGPADETIARLKGDVRGSGRGTERKMTEKETGSSNAGSPRSNSSSEKRSWTHKKGR